jgi:hypothetical protein
MYQTEKEKTTEVLDISPKLLSFHIYKLNNLKVIDDLYSQCLTQALS